MPHDTHRGSVKPDKPDISELSVGLTFTLILPIVLFWDFSLIELGKFAVTPVYILAVAFMILVYRLRLSIAFILILIAAAVLPLINGIVFLIRLPDFTDEFFQTYSLWILNLLLICSAVFLPIKARTPFLGVATRFLLSFLFCYVVIQIVLATVLENFALYNIFGSFGSHDDQAITRWTTGRFLRPTGPFYEPSALGRIMITLWLIALFDERYILRVTIITSATVLLSMSVGSIVLLTLLILCFVVTRFSFDRSLTLILCGVCVVLLFFIIFPEYTPHELGLISERLTGAFRAANVSSYHRIGAGVDVLSQVIPKYPFGVALGLDEYIVNIEGIDKLANGILELTLYFGVLSILVWLTILGWFWTTFWQRDWQKALLLIYVMGCTVVSGSWFQLQFNTLLVILIYAYRQMRVSEGGNRAIH